MYHRYSVGKFRHYLYYRNLKPITAIVLLLFAVYGLMNLFAYVCD